MHNHTLIAALVLFATALAAGGLGGFTGFVVGVNGRPAGRHAAAMDAPSRGPDGLTFRERQAAFRERQAAAGSWPRIDDVPPFTGPRPGRDDDDDDDQAPAAAPAAAPPAAAPEAAPATVPDLVDPDDPDDVAGWLHDLRQAAGVTKCAAERELAKWFYLQDRPVRSLTVVR